MIELAIFTVALVELVALCWVIHRDQNIACRDVAEELRRRRYHEIREAEHAAWRLDRDRQWKLTIDGVQALKLALVQKQDFERACDVRNAAQKAEAELNALLAVVRKVVEDGQAEPAKENT